MNSVLRVFRRADHRTLEVQPRVLARLSIRLWKWASAKGGEKGADERRAGEGNKSGRGGR